MDQNKKKLLYICIFVAVVVITELFYRNPLFNASLNAELKLKQCKSCVDIELYFTLVGSEYSLIALILLVYFFFPLSKTFAAAVTMLTSNYMNSFLKLIIQNPRPWFVSSELYVNCEGGYGNPSGHAMSSAATMFAVAELFIDRYKPSSKIECIIYVITGFIVGNVGLSRIFLGFHSINQIIYGFLLGFSVYYFYFHYLKIHTKAPRTLFNEVKNLKFGIIYTIIVLVLLILIPLYSSLFVDENSEEYKKYLTVIYDKCKAYPIKTYRILDKECIYGSMTMTSLIGMYFGLYFLAFKCANVYPTKEEYINNYFRESNGGCKNIMFMIGVAFLGMLPMILFSVIPRDANHTVIYIFKVGLPLCLTTGLLFGGVPYACIYYHFANKNIYTRAEIRNEEHRGNNNINNENDRPTTDNENERLNNNLNVIENSNNV